MSEPYIGEIKMFGFNFPPRGWAECNGQLLPINQNTALFSILGTTYGGDGRTTFGLPGLRGRTPVHPGNGISLGERSGSETETLSVAQMPSHDHQLTATTQDATTTSPASATLAATSGLTYGASRGETATQVTVLNNGGGQAHANMQPYTTVQFCIALTGLFPSRN